MVSGVAVPGAAAARQPERRAGEHLALPLLGAVLSEFWYCVRGCVRGQQFAEKLWGWVNWIF